MTSTNAPTSTSERRLAAIVFTDVVGYSARVQSDEVGTLALVRVDFARMTELCQKYTGEVLNTMGDGMLLCFASAVQAVACASEIQAEFGARATRDANALQHRMGIHVGDVFRDRGQVVGDGVNLAARLQTKALPGGVCISQTVHDMVKGKLPLNAEPLGAQSFKNIAEPVPVFRLAVHAESNRAKPIAAKRLWPWAIAAVALVAGGFWLAYRATAPARSPVPPNTELPAPIKPEGKSIAVLPFLDMSQAKDQEYFSDGLSEELLNLLAKVHELRVIARTSSFSFKGKEVTIAEVAQKLGVTHVLEGSVRKSGNTVRITAQLIRAADGSHLWSETYDRDLTDIFKVQDEIAAAVVSRLEATLLGHPSAERSRSQNIQAYTLLLKGRFAMARQGKVDLETAVDCFQRAVQIEPDSAPAWVALATAYSDQLNVGYELKSKRAADARNAALKAVALDPTLGEAYAALARIQGPCDWDWAAAEVTIAKALALDPGNNVTLRSAGQIAQDLGQFDKAAKYLRESIALDPLRAQTLTMLSYTLYMAGRYPEAAAAARQALAQDSTLAGVRFTLSHILVAQGQTESAYTTIMAEPEAGWRLCGLQIAAFAAGRRAESDAALKEYAEKFANIGSFDIGEAHAFRGESDLAFEWLERAYAQREVTPTYYRFSPFLKNLQGDPRMIALLRRMEHSD